MKSGSLSSFCAFLGLFLSGCGGGGSGGAGDLAPARVEVAAQADEQFTLVAPADVGMNGSVMARTVTALPDAGAAGLASMIVMRHGKPVMEEYWNGYDKDTLHDLRSATKSVTSLLVGIAIDRHVIAGVDETLGTRLRSAYPAAPALQQDITMDDLLTMRSGLACDDRDSNSPGNETKMYQTTDWVGFALALPQRAAPGTDTHYCTAGAVLLGRVIAEAGRTSIPAWSDAMLFAPLGIATARWAEFDHRRQTDTGGHLQMRPRDMAKLGQLVNQGGRWGGRQLVSAAWIATASQEHTLMDGQWKYGYLWWLKPEPFHGRQVMMQFAWGNGGQYIFVIPEADLVVVFTGENYDSAQAELPIRIVEQDILPSIE